MEKEKPLSGSVLHVTQPIYNPKDLIYKRDKQGKLCQHPIAKEGSIPLITKSTVDSMIKRIGETKEIAWIIHDKDTYSSLDVLNAEIRYENIREKGLDNLEDYSWLLEIKEGEPKPPHIHVILRSILKNGRRSPIRVRTVARELNIPENQIKIIKGRGGFTNQLEYLTHKKDNRKHRYKNSDVHANFDWENTLSSGGIDTEKRGDDLNFGPWIKDLNPKNKNYLLKLWLGAVRYDGMSLRVVSERIPIEYMMNETKFNKARMEYIANTAPMPKTRFNILIHGTGGVGKSLLAKSIARTLYPDLDPERDAYFHVGGHGVRFQCYDGQPVIIWSDVRSFALIKEFGTDGLFDMLDIHPHNGRKNVKYGQTRLLNEISVLCTIEEPLDFLEGLVTTYDRKGLVHKEDIAQAYRRFPIIVTIDNDSFSVYLNNGITEPSKGFSGYHLESKVEVSLRKLAAKYRKDEELMSRMSRMISPIVNAFEEAATALLPPSPTNHFKCEHYLPEELVEYTIS